MNNYVIPFIKQEISMFESECIKSMKLEKVIHGAALKLCGDYPGIEQLSKEEQMFVIEMTTMGYEQSIRELQRLNNKLSGELRLLKKEMYDLEPEKLKLTSYNEVFHKYKLPSDMCKAMIQKFQEPEGGN